MGVLSTKSAPNHARGASRGAMTHDEAISFARRWTAMWSAKDVEAVLGHFAEGVRFTSPRAALTVGSATVAGKDALRAYWAAAAARIESIHFTFDRAVWDPARRELVVVYDAEISGQQNRACEFMRFDDTGHVVEGEAMYGALL